MPIYEYEAQDKACSCEYCSMPFELIQKVSDRHLETCPKCGSPVRRIISAPVIGASTSGFDSRARNAGFHKLKKLGKGEYEKLY